jgi:hypothetical protein
MPVGTTNMGLNWAAGTMPYVFWGTTYQPGDVAGSNISYDQLRKTRNNSSDLSLLAIQNAVAIAVVGIVPQEWTSGEIGVTKYISVYASSAWRIVIQPVIGDIFSIINPVTAAVTLTTGKYGGNGTIPITLSGDPGGIYCSSNISIYYATEGSESLINFLCFYTP